MSAATTTGSSRCCGTIRGSRSLLTRLFIALLSLHDSAGKKTKRLGHGGRSRNFANYEGRSVDRPSRFPFDRVPEDLILRLSGAMVAGRGGGWRLAVFGGYPGTAGRGAHADRAAPRLWLHHYTPAAADADSRAVDRVVWDNDGKTADRGEELIQRSHRSIAEVGLYSAELQSSDYQLASLLLERTKADYAIHVHSELHFRSRSGLARVARERSPAYPECGTTPHGSRRSVGRNAPRCRRAHLFSPESQTAIPARALPLRRDSLCRARREAYVVRSGCRRSDSRCPVSH